MGLTRSGANLLPDIDRNITSIERTTVQFISILNIPGSTSPQSIATSRQPSAQR
ncbi:hypothetical protein H6G17_27110 [Chroococcidiopsis sp. FACHB-1243]|uniref:hypothetical protein n=1 Tax=Chroococcidiopsis sp. [FACHB-1243] TaxID=2692781 RepID=UPI00177CDBBE|nr:hypothetical protein [Chroococcidiopsis sp. [FACHB-1243]]MBD2309132.1 hypothetical protein [Chroococcidiopsis sp. [FACHB-1243]]